MDCPDFPGHELDVRRSDGQLERQVSTLVPGQQPRERLKRQERENLEKCGKI